MKRSVGHEQYFTDPELAERCVAFAGSLLSFDEFALFVEPSAGEGAFLRLLPRERRIGIDLEPRDADIARADFLQWEAPTRNGPILTIGNPPFGQRAALAMEFMARACTFSAAVAFILPRSFNKYTFQDRVDPRFHLLGSFDCDGFSDASGVKQSVKTCFQVWSRGEQDRRRTAHATTHPHFEMRHCHLSRVSAGGARAPADDVRVHGPPGRLGLPTTRHEPGHQGKSLVHPTQGARCPQPVRAARLPLPGRHEHRAHQPVQEGHHRGLREGPRGRVTSGERDWRGRDPTGPPQGPVAPSRDTENVCVGDGPDGPGVDAFVGVVAFHPPPVGVPMDDALHGQGPTPGQPDDHDISHGHRCAPPDEETVPFVQRRVHRSADDDHPAPAPHLHRLPGFRPTARG